MNDSEMANNDLTKKCLAITYKEDSSKSTQTWHIVFDKDGKSPKLAAIDGCIFYETDEELYAVMAEEYDDIIMHGVTYNTEPYRIGHKQIGQDFIDYVDNYLTQLYTRENQLAKLWNECQEDDDEDMFEAMAEDLNNLSEEQYAFYTKDKMEEDRKELLTVLTEAEALECFHQYLFMDANEEITVRQDYLDRLDDSQQKLKYVRIDI